MYLSTKDLESLKNAVLTYDITTIEKLISKYEKKQKQQANKMCVYMATKRKMNKNYGNHYTYKNGNKR